MANARIEIEIKNPDDYIKIIKESSYRNRNIVISRKPNKLNVSIKADSSRELLASIDSIIKKLQVVSGTEKVIYELKGQKS